MMSINKWPMLSFCTPVFSGVFSQYKIALLVRVGFKSKFQEFKLLFNFTK